MGRKAEGPVPSQFHGLVHGGMIRNAGEPGELRETDGQGHLSPEGQSPGSVSQLGVDEGLHPAPSPQAQPQQSLTKDGILAAQIRVPGVRDP